MRRCIGASASLRETGAGGHSQNFAKLMRASFLHEVFLESRRVLASFSRIQELRREQSRDEICNRLEDSLIHIFLRFTRCLELALRHPQ